MNYWLVVLVNIMKESSYRPTKKYDFSKGARGKFYRKGAQFHLPIYLDIKLQSRLEKIARKRREGMNEIVNRLVSKEIELIQHYLWRKMEDNNLIEIARIYTDLVKVDNEIPESEVIAKDEINALRTKYHQILMDKMQEEGVEYSDRFDAMNKAFELVKNEALASITAQ